MYRTHVKNTNKSEILEDTCKVLGSLAPFRAEVEWTTYSQPASDSAPDQLCPLT